MSTNSDQYILGISCFYHDAAAALVKNGILVAAAEEERFTRKKHDEEFPINAIEFCLKEAGISVKDLSIITFYEKPILKLERILISFIQSWPFEWLTFTAAITSWLNKKLLIKKIIQKELGYKGKIYFSDHHMSHAASSFFVSPFETAAIITVDGVGEWATTTIGKGKGKSIEIMKEIDYPDSLGLFYSALTHFLGFKPNSDEYKVMGLASWGKPRYKKQLEEIFILSKDGSFRFDKNLFHGNFAFSSIAGDLEKILGFKMRKKNEAIEEIHKDLASSLQELTNEAMVGIAKHAREITREENLCLAGGVALNCVANSEVLKEAGFKHIFIQPAAGDAGGAVGAAFYAWHQVLGHERKFVMEHAFFGPAYHNEEIEKMLRERNIPYQYLEEKNLLQTTATLIAQQKAIGWFQGRMEFGPRALGNRSILADARNKENWQRLNLKIKKRESFRPFAPAIIIEKTKEYFDWDGASPFMLFTAKVISSDIPAVTHVDNSARLQTVDKKVNPLFYRLLEEFQALTGCPVIINTSFNGAGEPIVCTPEDALNTFLKTEMDVLVLDNFLIQKEMIQ